MDDQANTPPKESSDAARSGGDVHVLNEILAAFRKLEPGSYERMLDTVRTFLGIGHHPSANAPTVPHRGGATSTSEASFSEDRSPSPKQFLLEKQPKTDVERVACLAYYLTHYRDTPHFKTLDVSKLNTEAAQVKFSNAAVAVDNAAKQNYLVPASRGSKQISAVGEQFVLALPDREKAKSIMRSARPRRKARASRQQQGEEQQ